MKPNKTPVPEPKLLPSVPIRFDEALYKDLESAKERSGMSVQAIVRMGIRYFLPKFFNGEVNIKECLKAETSKKTA